MTSIRPLHAKVIGVVALGGAVGACARYGLSVAFPDPTDGSGFPWTVFAINVVGCTLLATLPAVPADPDRLVALAEQWGVANAVRRLVDAASRTANA